MRPLRTKLHDGIINRIAHPGVPAVVVVHQPLDDVLAHFAQRLIFREAWHEHLEALEKHFFQIVIVHPIIIELFKDAVGDRPVNCTFEIVRGAVDRRLYGGQFIRNVSG